jgi:hypothetical protein
MGDGRGGSVNWQEPGYVEPPRNTGNRTQTDYAQDPEVKETRRQAFENGSGK